MKIIKTVLMVITLGCSPAMSTDYITDEKDSFETLRDKISYLLTRKFELKGEDLFREVLDLDKKLSLQEEDIERFLQGTGKEEVDPALKVTVWVTNDHRNLRQAILGAALFPLSFDSDLPFDSEFFTRDHNMTQLVYSACYGNLEAISNLNAAGFFSCIGKDHPFYKSLALLEALREKTLQGAEGIQEYKINCQDFIDIEKARAVHKEYVKWTLLYNARYEGEDRRRYFGEMADLMKETLMELRGPQAGQSESVERRTTPSNNINLTKTSTPEKRVRIKYSVESKKMLNKKTGRTLSKGKTNAIIPVHQSTSRRLGKKEGKIKESSHISLSPETLDRHKDLKVDK